MSLRHGTIMVVLLLAGLCGCKGKAKEMSDYPYYLSVLEERWETAVQDARSGRPNVGISIVLLKDMEGAILTMKRSYKGPNREAAIAKLEQLARELRAEFNKEINLATVDLKLRPGYTEKDVGATIEKFYPRYRAFAEMVKE
ncbi:MAG: hypothetical protein B1H04_03480 [Planctomycetales bacterium 4484_123]|nr:MAG: hypothetical protein B1H04_03480 [Planctomycetales bacterium 4484_123]